MPVLGDAWADGFADEPLSEDARATGAGAFLEVGLETGAAAALEVTFEEGFEERAGDFAVRACFGEDVRFMGSIVLRSNTRNRSDSKGFVASALSQDRPQPRGPIGPGVHRGRMGTRHSNSKPSSRSRFWKSARRSVLAWTAAGVVLRSAQKAARAPAASPMFHSTGCNR